MIARRASMTAVQVRARADHAAAFLAAAQLVDELGDDAEIAPKSNIVGSLAVLAGIAASDAICGHALGERASGDNHGEAVKVLAGAHERGPGLARHLQRLLDAKSNTHYAATQISESKVHELVAASRRLVDGMHDVLRT